MMTTSADSDGIDDSICGRPRATTAGKLSPSGLASRPLCGGLEVAVNQNNALPTAVEGRRQVRGDSRLAGATFFIHDSDDLHCLDLDVWPLEAAQCPEQRWTRRGCYPSFATRSCGFRCVYRLSICMDL